MRLDLEDGARTTIHVAVHDTAATELRVAVFRAQAKLEAWCAANGVEEAIVGGFFARPLGTPLGEVRTHGVAREHVPFTAPFDGVRACVHVDGGVAAIVSRTELPAAPRGDLLQAGPVLVTGGQTTPGLASDVEGFGAGSGQFDSDITDGRYPRAAIGYDDTYVYAVVVDGRSDGDAGMSLTELADFMSERLGVTAALNLDGGGSATLAARDPEGAFHVINNPMDAHNVPTPGGSRELYSAIVFTQL